MHSQDSGLECDNNLDIYSDDSEDGSGADESEDLLTLAIEQSLLSHRRPSNQSQLSKGACNEPNILCMVLFNSYHQYYVLCMHV